MKMIKNLASVVTVAFAAFAAPLAARADVATGDIYSIDLVSDGIHGGVVPSEDKPLMIGQKAVIRVRLLNRDFGSTPKKWRVVANGSSTMADFFPPELGLKLGGQSVYAKWVDTRYDVTVPSDTYTDLYFEYVVKSGDLAMPAHLMLQGGDPASSTIGADYELRNVGEYSYCRLTNDDGVDANFHFRASGTLPEPTQPVGEPQNYCVSGVGLGLYVKTLDLDKNYAVPDETKPSDGIWRKIEQGGTRTSTLLPSIAVEGVSEAAVTMYVWSDAEAIAAPLLTDGAYEVSDVIGGTTYKRMVLPVSVPKNASSVQFAIKGLELGTAKVCMSSDEHLVADDAGTLVTNWVERLVQVVEPPDPYVAFSLQDPSGNPLVDPVNCTPDYKSYVAALVVTLSKPPTDKVTVKLNPKVGGGDGDDIFEDLLLGISTTPDGTPWTEQVGSVTFNKDETQKMLYIYALGSSKGLADYGVKFTPSAEGPGAAMFEKDDHTHTANLVVKNAKPEITRPTETTPIEDAMAGQTYSLDFTLTDAYKFMRHDDGYTFKYRVKINGSNSSWTTIDNVEVDSDSGEGTVDVEFEDEGEGKLEIYVLNADKIASAHVEVPVTVAGPKKAWATMDHADGLYAEGETARIKFNINPKAPGSKALYAFLVPITDDATNKMASTGFSTAVEPTGCPIAPGDSDSGANAISVSVLDGEATATYEVFICTQAKFSKTKSAGYSAGQFTISATNVAPVVKAAAMGGTDITQSGSVVAKPVAQGVEKVFRVDIGTSEPSQLDKDGALEEDGTDNRFYTQWKFGADDWVTVYGNPDSQSVAHTFFSPGDQVVKVRVQDKDMRKMSRWSNEFTFTVKVLDAPVITITPRNGTSYREGDTGETASRFDVSLSVAPEFASSDDRLVVDLTVELVGDAAKYDVGDCVLSKQKIEFRSGVDNAAMNSSQHAFFLRSLDGTSESAAMGFRVKATATAESQALDIEGKTWDAAEIEFTVINDKPMIQSPSELLDPDGKPISTPTTVGEDLSLSWALTDVIPDKEGMIVKWTTSEGKSKTYRQGTGTSTEQEEYRDDVMTGVHHFTFNSPGENKSVTIMVQDKDGGVDSRTIYYSIAASKTVQIVPHGPPSGNGTALSSKYQDKAAGLGAGRVWAANFATVENWVFMYNCGLATEWRVYGEGYKPGDTDTVVSENGGMGGGYAYGDPEKESFLYAWLQIVQEEDSAKPTDEYLAVVPEHRLSKNSGTLVNLPTEKGDDDSFPSTSLEAIFSKEWLASDNMGDINQDGIPDIYVKKYEFGVIDQEGNVANDDLKPITVANETGNIDLDFLPSSKTSIYGSLIPGLKGSWVTEGKAFDAKTEIRGYHECLNDAPIQAGITGVEPDRIYAEEVDGEWQWTENCTISEVEFMAWQEWATKNLGADAWKNPLNWKRWSPERPTDPCVNDTDDDGFDDGFEYYFWYRAHVGTMDGGVHRRLTGRAYDPRNPGEGKFIPSEVIARLMDPRSDLPAVDDPGDWKIDNSSAETRDTDNDGLPDKLEYEIGTNPFDFDTDGDGLPDGWELMIAGLDPTTPNSAADAQVDTLRNYDGDAMAISSYLLEQKETPVPVNYEHAKRWTFAVVREGGDTDGVQWYATSEDPTAKLVVDEANTWVTWYRFSANGVDYCAETAPVTVDGRLATDTRVYTIAQFTLPEPEPEPVPPESDDGDILQALTDDKPAGEDVRGFPVLLPAGTPLDGDAEEMTEPLKAYKFGEAIDAAKANACWIYGKGTANALHGEVAETAADYGCLALARQLAVDEGAAVCAFPADTRDVAFIHYLCYQEFGFDPRTAWKPTTPLAPRWATTLNGEPFTGLYPVTQGGYAGIASRTRAFTAYDEFLVCSFFYNNLTDGVNGGTLGFTTYVTDPTATDWAKTWAGLTTNPQGPNEPGLIAEENYFGRNSDQGADTDGDGVPDGWELYVMAGPKGVDMAGNSFYVFAPPYDGFKAGCGKIAFEKSLFSPFVAEASNADTANPGMTGVQDPFPLTELRKFAGTDTTAYYADYATTIVRPEADAKWLNKFFPCDPWSVDTDRDGLSDGQEGQGGVYGFVYGEPADNGKLWSIPGGGLNPCGVDTDRDGLPDGWEVQFKGKTMYAGDMGNKAKDADGNEVGNYLQGLVDGMDGTVADAFNYPLDRTGNTVKYTVVNGVNQVVDRDYDHDGLDNWQEYLTGTMRCWRYDDPVSPMNGIPSSAYYYENEDGDVVFDPEKAAKTLLGEEATADDFWYATLVDGSSPIFNPHLVTDTSSGAAYFSRVENVWDVAYLDKDLTMNARSGAYYWFHNRTGDQMLGNIWAARWKELGVDGYDAAPSKYASCSPIDPDSDHDGMDDYYELFHGMNPLLGASGVKGKWTSIDGAGGKHDGDALDLVYDALSSMSGKEPQAWGTGDSENNYKNFWQRYYASLAEGDAEEEGSDEGEGAAAKPALPRGTGYDFVFYPWLGGLATADADGDGIRNQEEAIMPLVAPTSAWHHSDPTPLWMTDSSYSNSLVRGSYRMPIRSELVALPGLSFTHGETEYLFSDFDGFDGKESFLPFNPDRWGVGTSQKDMNWIASFEENEGYDSDHDGVPDRDELSGKYGNKTDPLDADSPRRRQAMYFQGKDKPSIVKTLPEVAELHPDSGKGNKYPDDMSFLQFTVECWVKADAASLDDATVIERVMWTNESNPADKEFVRCNFRLGLRGGKWFAKFDPNDTTLEAVEAMSPVAASTEWTHLAATYDMENLRLFVNGQAVAVQPASLQPAYGSASVAVDGVAGWHADPGMAFWRTRKHKLCAILLGASAKTCAEGATRATTALDEANGTKLADGYDHFFRGYVDEVRIWDGARSVKDVQGDVKTRYTAEMAAANREAFYNEWAKGSETGLYRGRYATDGSGVAYQLPAELRYHWTFDSVFAGDGEANVATVPAGFLYAGPNGDDGRAPLSRPDGYEIAWWKTLLENYGSVYAGATNWVTWIPNTVTHLPRFDGTTIDSRYWSEDFAGDKLGVYRFARTAEPASLWTQYVRKDGAYTTTSSRNFFLSKLDYENSGATTFSTVYEFTGRHLNQVGDDLLPLGGAYVQTVPEMWDGFGASENWEISDEDFNGDGLPDWWVTKVASGKYFDLGMEIKITWGSLVHWPDQNGRVMTAGQAYMHDLARGYRVNADGDVVLDEAAAQNADQDGNGIPDWWERLYGIVGCDPAEDTDGDGLPNEVEYLLSEVFEFGVVFSPVNPCSADPYTLDYFFKVGDLYVGEIFTDHDLVDDAWEDLYDDSYSSRLIWDAYKDADGDGWSNRSECRYSRMSMPIQAEKQSHYASTDVTDSSDGRVVDYPVPTIALTVKYSGARTEAVAQAPIVVKMTTDENLTGDFDATFNVAGETGGDSQSTKSSGKDDTAGDAGKLKRYLGKWSNRHVVGTLTPGYIKKDSVLFQFAYDPSAEIYSWSYELAMGNGSSNTVVQTRRGTLAELQSDIRKYTNVKMLSKDASFNVFDKVELRTNGDSTEALWFLPESGTAFGTLDLQSGAFDIDLGVFAGMTVYNKTNVAEVVSLEDQTFRIAYTSNMPKDLPRKLYLGEATTGHVREGKNKVIAWADLDGNGAYTPGEPFGCVAGLDVSWRGTSAEIELTETSVICPRMNIATGESDREVVWGSDSGYWTNLVVGALNGGTKTRVRVIRTVYNTDLVTGLKSLGLADNVSARVVLDKYVDLNAWPVITEADFISESSYDIDWNTLSADILTPLSGKLKDLNALYYRVVLGDGTIDLAQDNNLYKVMFGRYFDPSSMRVRPTGLVPGNDGEQQVVAATPTFRWSMGNSNTYTSFKIQVKDAANALVYDSGYQRAPQSSDGNYSWTSPILYVGDKTPSGKVFADQAQYTWQVSMYNSKFTGDSWATGGKFFMNARGVASRGTASVAVKYYGPKLSYAGKTIRVKAFTSPDFTGVPVGSGYVALPDDAQSGVAVMGKEIVENCTIVGLPKGTYYLQAFIDSNNNGVCDKWESMGYLCNRFGTADDNFDPIPVTFAGDCGASDLAKIYIEDADTDGDSLPDAWEYAKYGSLTAKGTEAAQPTAAGNRLVAKDLEADILKHAKGEGIAADLAGRILTTMSSSRTFMALASGVTPEALEPEVEIAITGLAFNAAENAVEIAFGGDVTAPGQSIANALYTYRPGETLRFQVYHTDNLAEEWKPVGDVRSVKVEAGNVAETLKVGMEGLNVKGGFFRVVVVP